MSTMINEMEVWLDGYKAGADGVGKLRAIMNGQQLKMEALDHFEVTAQTYLFMARTLARAICIQKGEVTSDDIQESLPIPQGVHQNVAGAIFRTGFVRLGYRQSKRPSSHARTISRWALPR